MQIIILGMACAVCACADSFRTPEWRPYRALMFVLLGLSGVIPVLHGLALDGIVTLSQRMGLYYVLLEAVLYITGAFIYAVRVT